LRGRGGRILGGGGRALANALRAGSLVATADALDLACLRDAMCRACARRAASRQSGGDQSCTAHDAQERHEHNAQRTIAHVFLPLYVRPLNPLVETSTADRN